MKTIAHIAEEAFSELSPMDKILLGEYKDAVLTVARIAAEAGMEKGIEQARAQVIQEVCDAGVNVLPGYLSLFGVLCEALGQAQHGKGAERHNLGGTTPFERQRMQQISELIGSVHGMTYQACKKITEGVALPMLDRQIAELLGAINYIAGMVIFLRKHAAKNEPELPLTSDPDDL